MAESDRENPHKRTMKMRTLLLLLTVFGFCLQVYAEVPQTYVNKAQRGQTRRPTAAKVQFKADPLTEPVDFPNVPRYPGKAVFLRGFRCPDEQYVGMTLGVNEAPDQVKQWYEDALKTYSWKVLKNSSGPNQVIAIKEDNTFSMMILPRQVEGVRTVVDLSFYYGR